jgi:hypothetical protein
VTGLNHLPKTNAEARVQGAKHYFTGRPCKNGHIRERLSSTGDCVPCITERTKAYNNTPKGRELKKELNRLWGKSPNGRLYRKRQKFQRKKRYRLATPQWVNMDALLRFVEDCPESHHIDHIIPLRGTTVCGLHVLENLQYLPAQENLSKNNRIDPLSLEAVVCVLPAYRSY